MDDDDWFHLSESWSWTVVVPSWWSFQNYYLVLRRFTKEQASVDIICLRSLGMFKSSWSWSSVVQGFGGFSGGLGRSR